VSDPQETALTENCQEDSLQKHVHVRRRPTFLGQIATHALELSYVASGATARDLLLKGNVMNVHISSTGRTSMSKRMRQFVTERVDKATQRFTDRIRSVEVSVANSADAVDQECRVVFAVDGQGSIVATAHSDNIMAAIAEAMDRAKRGLSRTMSRTRKRRAAPPLW